ncbi:Mif2/CENP-C like-domain-containing protein [Lentinula aff. detonsa]|uniref:CENP-C homolog n=1 Tax=Lentinula aff. detonsa TaxID=2804958 RepID=A0AA38NUF5_9AGAR|nr:Mif2/CENP-C like-domain-containing protein [Lentinula aff. detonsa]KAJ3802465.1 Mif2/CENP-C like-domain-containing protein [Lentinula aff. detonsa]
MPEVRHRQSSIGARRRPPKAHIPYRGNSLEVTRKTGVKVAHDPDSDGFETYEHFAQQADKITPYQVKGTKNKKDIAQEPEPQEDEGEGDSDMEIDSPIHYIANSRQPSSPISRRASLMSRPVARNTANQFDDVPSPHTRLSAKSRRDHTSAGPSRLSQRFNLSDDHPISTTTRDTNGLADMSIDTGFPDDLSIQHRSFTELDQDAFDDDEMYMDEPPIPSPKRRKGAPISSDAPSPKRQRGQSVERISSAEELPPRTHSPDVEEEIQQQLADVDQHSDNESPGDQEEEREEEEEEPIASKKSKVDKGKENQKPKGQGKKKEIHREGVRRSQRKPIKPLEWWRNEKYVYERPTHGTVLVPHIKEIIRIPEEPKEPLGKHAKRKRGRSKTVQLSDQPNPEEGWDHNTNSVVTVMDWKTKEPKEKRIICLAKDVELQRAASSEWAYQRSFGDDNFVAAGHLTIPVHGRKPTKTTKDNTYTFYLIQGAINLKIHETSSILCTGAHFMVPRGNTYFIENIGDREAKLFFSQARQDPTTEDLVSPRKSSALSRIRSAAGPSKSLVATKRANTTGV